MRLVGRKQIAGLLSGLGPELPQQMGGDTYKCEQREVLHVSARVPQIPIEARLVFTQLSTCERKVPGYISYPCLLQKSHRTAHTDAKRSDTWQVYSLSFCPNKNLSTMIVEALFERRITRTAAAPPTPGQMAAPKLVPRALIDLWEY